jgi:hypothetical protein
MAFTKSRSHSKSHCLPKAAAGREWWVHSVTRLEPILKAMNNSETLSATLAASRKLRENPAPTFLNPERLSNTARNYRRKQSYLEESDPPPGFKTSDLPFNPSLIDSKADGQAQAEQPGFANRK